MTTATKATINALLPVLDELNRARALYPWWPDDLIRAAAIAAEESGEVVKSCNDLVHHNKATLEDIRAEAIQAAAMWLRFLIETPGVRRD